MGSVNEEINRIAEAKAAIEVAIEDCGVDVPDEDRIEAYAARIKEIPDAVFAKFTLDQPIGGEEMYIKSISQTNGLVSATTGTTTDTVSQNSTALVTSGGVYNEVIKYLPLAGGTLTGDLILKSNTASADTPALIFQRGSNTDSYYDIKMFNSGGTLRINESDNATDTEIAVFGKTNTALQGSLTVAKALTLTGTADSTVASINFSRGSETGTTWNYITAPLGGNIAIAPNGISKTSTTGYHFGGASLYPGTTNTYSLGTSSLKWSNVYATKFTGNLVCTGANHPHIKGNDIQLSIGYGDTSQLIFESGAIRRKTDDTTTTLGTSTYPWKNVYATNFTGSLIGNADTATALTVKSKGSAYKPIYWDGNGQPVACTYSLSATVNSGATGKLAYYSGANTIDDLTVSANTTETLYITGINSSSKFYSGTQSSLGVRITGGNTIYAGGGFFESSDERLKDFYEDIEVDLDKLAQLPKKYFTWKDGNDKGLQIGTSAQAVKELYPELVGEDEDGTLSVAYDKLSVVALAAVDKLHEEISSLQKKNTELEDRISKLENLLLYGKEH